MGTRQFVPAKRTAHTANKSGAAQVAGDLLEVMLAEVLAFGNEFQ